jgi:hypothetical protein
MTIKSNVSARFSDSSEPDTTEEQSDPVSQPNLTQLGGICAIQRKEHRTASGIVKGRLQLQAL